MRLAVVITHPIQYYAPLFQLLNRQDNLQLKVFYTWSQAQQGVFDAGFQKTIRWDIPLLTGYDYSFIPNTASKPGCNHFMGIQNPSLIPDIHKWKPDAVWVIGWNYQSHLRLMRACKKYRIPVYFSGDSTLLDEKPGLHRLMRRMFLRWVYRHVDYALYAGQHNRAYFLAHGLKPHQLIYAPHAVDNERFADEDGRYMQQALAWRKQMGIEQHDCVFLFAGKLVPKKNPMLLLQAFQHLRNSPTHLVFVGNGVLEQSLKKQVMPDSWLAVHVHFMPFQNQSIMPAVYRMGDVFVLPSQGPGETWGLAVNEAMACGIPVIVSNRVGCAPDLVIEGKTGWVFEAGKIERLAEIMKQIVRMYQHEPYHLKQIGNQAYQHIQRFSFHQVTDNFIRNMQSERYE
ncbi:glycosyltransferase involved in cell wall biosynthesis [Thermoflavifilum aggregans]|uniref:Glycosyltransferase involved in cell wall biosynthesis n=1 Tax=Thermoflavifilum aggregans TaxID=454188 RepID=A0A2M9CS05_9BACT|nr:glycosyltransferase family 4 protein [Thermoflavifilum aggregans]PJJ74684.1 glycosyltransferase involved in cell wall biosynthesis [Thermoflavifilum aggregans]